MLLVHMLEEKRFRELPSVDGIRTALVILRSQALFFYFLFGRYENKAPEQLIPLDKH